MAAIRKTFTDASGDHRTFDVTEVGAKAMERLLGSAMPFVLLRIQIEMGEALGRVRRQLLLGGPPASDFVDGVGGYDAPTNVVCAGTRHLKMK